MKKIVFIFIGILASVYSCKNEEIVPDLNTPPVADAGKVQNVPVGTLVTLDGSASYDAERDPLTFSWKFASKPEASMVTLSDANKSHPRFTPDVEGVFVLELIVNDGKLSSAPAEVTITASIGNSAPVAHAGVTQNVTTGTQVTLDGSASTDADKDVLSFSWKIVAKPSASSVVLSAANESHPTFVPDLEGDYLVELTVNDGTVNSLPDTVKITATATGNNAVPIAHAGADRSVHTGVQVTLDGSASYDANGHPLTYSWTIRSKPAGSLAALSDTTSIYPTITPDVEGPYVIELIVHDGTIDSTPDQVTITATTFSNKEQLMLMGLDAADADYLIAHHLPDVITVLNDPDRIFKDMPALDNMFALPTDPDGAAFTNVGSVLTFWSEENKAKFKKMFGRFVFVINAPKFQQAFNDHIGLLDPANQGNPPAVPYPANYTEFRAAANAALIADQYQYKFFISSTQTWVAWGMPGLKLQVENIMFGPPTAGAPHNTEALILHEITHTWGYAHDGPDVTLKPNNIPYYVQFLVGVSYKDPASAPVWDTPDALLTIYFGNP